MMATFAGAPPGTFKNPRASARDTPDTVGTKSISIPPKLRMGPPAPPLTPLTRAIAREKEQREKGNNENRNEEIEAEERMTKKAEQ